MGAGARGGGGGSCAGAIHVPGFLVRRGGVRRHAGSRAGRAAAGGWAAAMRLYTVRGGAQTPARGMQGPGPRGGGCGAGGGRSRASPPGGGAAGAACPLYERRAARRPVRSVLRGALYPRLPPVCLAGALGGPAPGSSFGPALLLTSLSRRFPVAQLPAVAQCLQGRAAAPRQPGRLSVTSLKFFLVFCGTSARTSRVGFATLLIGKHPL